MVLLYLFGSLAGGQAFGQTCVIDDPLNQAITVQLPVDGLDALGAVAPALLPELLGDDGLVIDDIEESLGGCNEFSLTGAYVGLEVDDVSFEVNGDVLDLVVDLTAWLNLPGDRFSFAYEFGLFGLCGGDECAGWVDPFGISARIPIGLGVVPGPDGHNVLDASIGEIALDNGLNGDLIHFNTGCAVQTIEAVLNLLGLSLYDFIIGLADDLLLGVLGDQIGDIELTLDEVLGQIAYVDTLDVLDTSLFVDIEPFCVETGPEGVELLFHGSAEADPHPCVADWDDGVWAETDGPRPALSDALLGAHAGVLVADDLVTQISYMAWSGGLLCYEIQDGDLTGFPIDSSLLSLLGGDGYHEILPEEPGPLAIRTIPLSPPTAEFGGDHDVTLVVRDLQLGFFTDIDYRSARALSLDLEADVGMNLGFNELTGELAVDIALGAEQIRASAGHDRMVDGVDQYVEDSFSGVLEGILDLVVGDLLTGLVFPLPAIEGVGVSQMEVDAPGGGEWLGVWVAVDAVDYGTGAGCDEQGGCDAGGCADASSCDQGCATSGGNLAGWLGFAVPLFLLRRRSIRGASHS